MTKNKLSALIEKHQDNVDVDILRDYIGASSIGSECFRQIWYQFKGQKGESVPAKLRRTWAIGKHLERLIIDWLIAASVEVEFDAQTYSARNVPIFQGHVDALVKIGKNRAILEIKTAKDASFKVFVNKGLKLWNHQYYAQVQSYMGMSGIMDAYILVLNKDNSEIADELVRFDEEYYQKLESKALMISTATIAPPKINSSPLWYQCKICKFNKVCHK